MAERPTKVTLPGGQVADAFEVPVEESIERWSELKLEDGSILRVKINVITVTRVQGMWDAQGNPFYAVNAAPVMAVVDAPENLRKKVQ
jgi:hypothetical protein